MFEFVKLLINGEWQKSLNIDVNDCLFDKKYLHIILNLSILAVMSIKCAANQFETNAVLHIVQHISTP